jgi:hypothetical protein
MPENSNLTNIPAPSTRVVPPGKSLADVPRGEPIPTPDGKPKPRNAKQTLRQLITHEENVEVDVVHPLLKCLIKWGSPDSDKPGPWREYLAFYRANHSGDVSTFSDRDALYVEKLVDDLEKAYAKTQIKTAEE